MMENNDQEIRDNITIVNQGNDGTWMAGQNLIGHMLNAEQNRQNFANILNDQKLGSEFIEAILGPKPRLNNTSVLQKYLDSRDIDEEDKQTVKQALVHTLFSGNPALLQAYLNDGNIRPENKQQNMKALMNTLFSGDPGLLQEYLDNNNIDEEIKRQVKHTLVHTLLLYNNNESFLEQYLARDNRVPGQNKIKCCFAFIHCDDDNIIKTLLEDPNYDHNKKLRLIETFFKPRDELNGKSYFREMDNRDGTALERLDAFLSQNNNSTLLRQCLERIHNNENEYIRNDYLSDCLNENLIEGTITIRYLRSQYDDRKKYELAKTIFELKHIIKAGYSSLDIMLERIGANNNQSVLEQYLADPHIDGRKKQYMNRFVNVKLIDEYLSYPDNGLYNKKFRLIKTLFKPRDFFLNNQSCFDRDPNKQFILTRLLLGRRQSLLERYLADRNIDRGDKEQCVNGLIDNGVIKNYLSNPYSGWYNKKVARLIKILFKPRDFLNNQSCFDRDPNKQSILNSLLSDNNRSVLERYLADRNIDEGDKEQCMNGLINNGVIENYLSNPHNGLYNKKVSLIKILFKPRDFLNGESYFDRIENKQLIRNSFLAGEEQSLLERYLADNDINANDKLQCLNVLNSYTETQDLLTRVRLEPELAVIQTLFARQNDGLNNQLPLDQYLNDVNIPVKNKARTLNSIFTIIGRMNREDAVRINMLNDLNNTLTRQSFVTNFEQGTIQMQRLAIENAGNEEHLQDRKTTFLHIMMDPRYDPEYGENLDITSDINRKEVIHKIGQICPELLLDARDQLGNTVLNQTILLPYPNTIQREVGEALQQHEAAAEACLQAARMEFIQRKEVQRIEQVMAQDDLEGAQENLQKAQANLQDAQANLQAAQDNLQLAQENLELQEIENKQACQRLLQYDDYVKSGIMSLLIEANTNILYPRIQQRREGQQVVPPAEQQVRGNANQENNGNQENHEENGQALEVVPPAEQHVIENVNQENNGNQENHGENGQVVQRREADSPLIMLIKNNNWFLFSSILRSIELQTQGFNRIEDNTLNVALNEAGNALYDAAGCGGYGGLNTCNFNYFLSRPFEYVNDFDNDLIESRKLNTKLVPGLKHNCEHALELKSDNNYMLYKELNFYSPRLGEARNLINPRGNKTLNNVNFEGHTFEDTINDYLSCYQAIEETYNMIRNRPNQIQNGQAPAVREHAEPEVAPQPEPEVVPPAEQQVRGIANQENNGNQQNHINQQNQGENGQALEVVPLAEQQVRGNANQENNGNQQNHINQQNHEENGQIPVVNEQVEVQAEPQVQERRRPRGGLERMGGANGLRGDQVGGRNGNNRGNGIVGIND